MNKKIDKRCVGRINWSTIEHARTKQKIGLREAIEKVGNARQLSIKCGVSAQLISNAVHFSPVKKDTNIVSPLLAINIAKAADISGLEEIICPSLKRSK